MADTFLIKHRSSGKYFHPQGGDKIPKDETPIVMNKEVHERMYWTFEKVRNHWGYIKHVESGKIIHPQGGELDSKDNTPLVLNKDRHDGALFALDTYNNLIVHTSGRFAQPNGCKPNPPNETAVMLHSNDDASSRFLFVSPKDKVTAVLVYGKPTVTGKWKILHSVINPKAEHTEKMEITIGKSRSESEQKQSKNQYSFEVSGEGDSKKFFKIAAKFTKTVEDMFEKSSSSTWSEETKQSREIRVKPGKTVVTWQYVFVFEDCDTKSMFKSNMIADTESESEEPQEPQFLLE